MPSFNQFSPCIKQYKFYPWWWPILVVGHRACKKIISRVCCFHFQNCGRLQKNGSARQRRWLLPFDVFYQKFLLQDTTIIAATNAAGKYWVSMVSDTSLSHIARDYVLIQLTFFVIYIVLIIRIQVSHGQTSKTSVYCMIWIMKLWLTKIKC